MFSAMTCQLLQRIVFLLVYFISIKKKMKTN